MSPVVNLPWSLFVVGSACTLLGLGLYLFASGARGKKNFYTWVVLAWLFIPVFPLVFMLAAFPGSIAEGQLWQFKMGGAFASYVFLWYGGIRLTGQGVRTDEERKRVAKLEEISQYVAVIKPILDEGAKPKLLLDTDTYEYEVHGTRSRLGLVTGDLASIRCADVWVNSENTNMQMARFGDRSFSSTIRYLGAEKDIRTGMVKDDVISKALSGSLGESIHVAPAFVIRTSSGELERTNSVRHIFHVAAVTAEPGAFRPIGRLQDCITNCLAKADTIPDPIHTILFPLIGTGTGKGNLEESVERLLKAAITYLLQHHATTNIRVVYFVTATDLDLAVCQKVLAATDKVSRVA